MPAEGGNLAQSAPDLRTTRLPQKLSLAVPAVCTHELVRLVGDDELVSTDATCAISIGRPGADPEDQRDGEALSLGCDLDLTRSG